MIILIIMVPVKKSIAAAGTGRYGIRPGFLFSRTTWRKHGYATRTQAARDLEHALFGPLGTDGDGPAQVAARLVHEQGVSCEDIARAHLNRIEMLEPKLRSFLPNSVVQGRGTLADVVLEEARGHDRTLAKLVTAEERRRALPLAGVTLGVKDNICAAGFRATAGSLALSRYVPPRDATVVDNLRRAGCVVVGKTLCDEFGMGSTTESSASQLNDVVGGAATTRNPWDLSRVPGGSSGGSAAAVSSRQCALALGTDTGGSVRQPASFCGVVGLKPTYGRVSRFGLIAYASSLDVPGCFGSTAQDCARMLDVIAGPDPADSSSAALPHPPPLSEGGYERLCRQVSGEGGDAKPLLGLKVGLVRETLRRDGTVEEGVLGAVDAASEALRGLGCEVKEVSLPAFDLSLPAYYVTAVSEASSNLSRYDGLRYPAEVEAGEGGDEGFGGRSLMAQIASSRGSLLGDEPLRRILMGTYTLSEGYGDALYKRAQVARKRVQQEMLARMVAGGGECDVLLTPTAPTTAYACGDKELQDPLQVREGGKQGHL